MESRTVRKPLRPLSRTRALALAALPLLAACVEQEERIEVAADGSVEVTVRADGHVEDLADGWPVPLDGPWRAADADTRRWVDGVGVAGPGRRERARTLFGAGEQVELAVTARFPSVDALPTTYAPAGEPYADAYLTRSASLAVERRGGRAVYVFERTLHGRRHVGERLYDDVVDELPEGLLDDPAAATDAQLADVASRFTARAAEYAEGFLRDALAAQYVDGPAMLPLATFEQIVADGTARAGRALDAGALTDLLRRACDAERPGEEGAASEGGGGTAEAFEALERSWRDALRGALADGLANAHVPSEVLHGVLARLEWSFTAYDHTDDLGDERLRVVVRLPGRVVAGNWQRLEDGAAVWEVEGQALRGADRVLRVVAVAE